MQLRNAFLFYAPQLQHWCNTLPGQSLACMVQFQLESKGFSRMCTSHDKILILRVIAVKDHISELPYCHVKIYVIYIHLKWVFCVALTFPGVVHALVWLWRLVWLTLVLHRLLCSVFDHWNLRFGCMYLTFVVSDQLLVGLNLFLYECLARRMLHMVAVLTFSVLFPPLSFKQNVDAWNFVLRSSFGCKLLENWCFLVLWRSHRVAKRLHFPLFPGLAGV